MSAECACAALVRRASTASGLHPALARSTLVSRTTSSALVPVAGGGGAAGDVVGGRVVGGRVVGTVRGGVVDGAGGAAGDVTGGVGADEGELVGDRLTAGDVGAGLAVAVEGGFPPLDGGGNEPGLQEARTAAKPTAATRPVNVLETAAMRTLPRAPLPRNRRNSSKPDQDGIGRPHAETAAILNVG
jgi:hypothetical protein